MYVKQFQVNSQKSYFTQEQSCGNWLTALVQLKPITPTSFTLYFHFYAYNVFMRLNTVPSFHLSCHCQELRRPSKNVAHRKTTFHRAKNIAKIFRDCFTVWTSAHPTEKKSRGKRGSESVWSGEESLSLLCWFCKSATSAAYFLPKHCSVEWSPQMGPFLIFVAMHYQVHWCMCALIAHSSAGWMRCLWKGG